MDTVINIGDPAPDFELAGLDGKLCRLSDMGDRIIVINFWSAECPWAERADRELLEMLAGWGEAVILWSIASNANEPIDLLNEAADERGLRPVLHDPGQRVADLYGALTTPHLFVVDRGGILRYQGGFDDTSFRQRTPTRNYLYEAVEALLGGDPIEPAETNPYGCTIVRHT